MHSLQAPKALPWLSGVHRPQVKTLELSFLFATALFLFGTEPSRSHFLLPALKAKNSTRNVGVMQCLLKMQCSHSSLKPFQSSISRHLLNQWIPFFFTLKLYLSFILIQQIFIEHLLVTMCQALCYVLEIQQRTRQTSPCLQGVYILTQIIYQEKQMVLKLDTNS